MKTVLLIYIGLVLSSCGKESGYNDARKYGEVLGSLIEDPVDLEVEIDTIGYQRVYASDQWVPLLREVSIGAFTLIEDEIIVGDDQNMKILLLTEEGALIHSFGRKGEGPGEFLSIDMIEADNKYIYIYDGRLSRLTVLDHELNLEDTMPQDWTSIDRVMWANNKTLLISERDNQNFLLSGYSSYPALKKKNLLIPRLLPPGVQPMAINNLIITGDQYQNVYTAFMTLPYVFRFDRRMEHQLTYKLTGEAINEFYEIPSQNKPQSTNSEAEHARILNSAMAASDKILYLIIRGRLTLFDLDTGKQTHQYVLYRRNGYMLSIKSVKVKDGKLYLLNRFDKNLVTLDLEKNSPTNYSELTTL